MLSKLCQQHHLSASLSGCGLSLTALAIIVGAALAVSSALVGCALVLAASYVQGVKGNPVRLILAGSAFSSHLKSLKKT